MSEEHSVLTKAKLLEMVQQYTKTDTVEILDSTVEPGVGKGENYANIVMRVDIKAKVDNVEKDFHWMVKLPPTDPQRIPHQKAMKIEEVEHHFYTKFLPKLQAFVKEKSGDFELNFCQLFYSEFSDAGEEYISILALENLRELGYGEQENKKKGMKLPEMKLALEALAQYHAVSYSFMKSYPGGLEEALEDNYVIARDFYFSDQEPHIKEFSEMMDKSMEPFNRTFLQLASEDGEDLFGSFDNYVKKMNKSRPQIIADINKRDPNFNVMLHGDTWFNNLLFKYEKGDEKPIGMKWLDMQLVRWGNPCLDLAYFLFLSVSPDMRKNNYDLLFDIYHRKFSQTLEMMGENPNVYSLSQLKSDYDKYSMFGYMSSIQVLPIILLRKEDVVDQSEFAGYDWNDPEQLKELMSMMSAKIKKGMDNEPYVATALRGNFMEMVQRGHFKL